MTNPISKQGCKIVRDTNIQVYLKYDKFMNNLKAVGGFVHGSQSHITPIPSTPNFEYTIFIYYEVPKDVDVTRL